MDAHDLSHDESRVSASEDSHNLVIRLAAGVYDHGVKRWAMTGFATWLRGGGELRLERCLHLPRTAAQMRKLRRDYWLSKAANMIDAQGPWTGAGSLRSEWRTFLTRGPWQAWRDCAEPPDGASDLRTALFFASKFNGGKDLSRKQLLRIVGHAWVEKCPVTLDKLELSHNEGSTHEL